MRLKAKRDVGEAAIVQALEQIGVVVIRVSSPGAPDLLCFDSQVRHLVYQSIDEARQAVHGQVWLPIELKTGKKKLTPAQQATRQRAPYPIVRTVAEALALFGVSL